MIDLKNAENDVDATNLNKVIFNVNHTLKGIAMNPDANIVLEL